MKNLLKLILVTVLVSCEMPEGEEGYRYVLTDFSLCTINKDGSELRELGERYNSDYVFFIQNDEQLLLLSHDRLRIIDLTNLHVLSSIGLNFNSFSHAEISQDESFLIISASRDRYDDIYLVNLQNLDIQNLTNTPELYERYPSFSHDASKIIYTTFPDWPGTVTDNQTITIYNLVKNQSDIILSRSNREDLMHVMEHFYYPKFDVSDSNIYYIRHNLNKGIFDSLFVYSIYGATRSIVYTNIYTMGLMKISNNRERAVIINNEYPHHLISLDLTNLLVNDITEFPERHWDYDISRNGTKIAYIKKIEKRNLNGQKVDIYYDYELWVSKSDGLDKKIIAHGKNPVFSKDGSKIAFHKVSHTIDK